MNAVQILRKKRYGHPHSREEIQAIVTAAATGAWPDYQLSAWLMAACTQGLNSDETAWLTEAMTNSGQRLDLSEFGPARVDKHSTGGVGDKTSLIIAPLAAACGVIVPMMSGRGLGHTGGTLDKLEAIPGFRVGLSIPEFKQALRRVGLGMISQTADVAPADKKLYALRDVTGTVESVPLITASILSKKLAEGIAGLVMDVKFGHGAFMKSLDQARELAESLVRVGTANGLKVLALLTAMNNPLGRMVGNALEVRESLEVLRGQGPPDLVELCLVLASQMVHLAGVAPTMTEARRRVEAALSSGQGLEKFRQMVEQQGGDPRVVDQPERLPTARKQARIVADRSGIIHSLNAEEIGLAAVELGAGRLRAEDAVDPAVGIQLLRQPGEAVQLGEAVLIVHHQDDAQFASVRKRLEQALQISSEFQPEPLISDTLIG